MAVLDKIVFDAKVSERKILLIPTNTIVSTHYNPKTRTKEGKALSELSASVKKYGVIQPLIITADRDLVDGNRRLKAAKLAGMQYVECIILAANVDKDSVFGDMNTTSEKIGGKGWLEAIRLGNTKAPTKYLIQYNELFKLIGTYGIDILIEKRIGLNILDLCKSVKALGLTIRLDALLMKVAQAKLTNRINAIYRSDISREEKVQMLDALLA